MRRVADRDDARHGHCTGMADAKLPFGNSKIGSGLCGTSLKPDLRRSSRGAMNDDISECHAGTEPGSQRLQDSFFRGEPASQALDPIGPVADLIQLFLNKAALDQRIARILDPAPHLGDVDQIDPMSDDVQFRRRSLPWAASRSAAAMRVEGNYEVP